MVHGPCLIAKEPALAGGDPDYIGGYSPAPTSEWQCQISTIETCNPEALPNNIVNKTFFYCVDETIEV